MDNLLQSFVLAQAFGGGNGGGGGGGLPVAEYNDVNFIDYDGTIRYSYSAADFAALTELPENPTHEGLTEQGWNWTLADAQAYVAEHGIITIGQMYITNDEKTRVHIRIDSEARSSVVVNFNQSVANGVTIDWGDNSPTETVAGTGNLTASHSYSSVGDYVISLAVENGCNLILGGGSTSTTLITGSSSDTLNAYRMMLRSIEIGNVSAIGDYAFFMCYNLESVTIPSGIKSAGKSSFKTCVKLPCIIISDGETTISNECFRTCYSARMLSIPNSITKIEGSAFAEAGIVAASIPNGVSASGSQHFYNCRSLKTASTRNTGLNMFSGCSSLYGVKISTNTTFVEQNAYNNCGCLTTLEIPSNITIIATRAFLSCVGLSSVKISNNSLTIASMAFALCNGVGLYDFTEATAVPTLSASDVFNSITSDCKIVVPDDLYDTWIAASNWSTYASYIMRESDYNA